MFPRANGLPSYDGRLSALKRKTGSIAPRASIPGIGTEPTTKGESSGWRRSGANWPPFELNDTGLIKTGSHGNLGSVRD
jgi:hypothetical protein